MSGEPAVDVPDQVLRSALEFAVGIAAADAKVRPPRPFPAELKRFLRVYKLPPAALAKVRAAIEDDDEFRRRLATAATTEVVDEVGVLWLSRPEGWLQSIANLLPKKIIDVETARLREERRRQAAESATARARADLLALRAELDRERSAKVAAVAETDRLRGELDDVRLRLREAQRAEHASAQALVKVEAQLIDAGRVAIEPSPVPSPVVAIDIGALRDWIDGAVAASTDVVRLLTAALAEVGLVDGQPEVVPPSRPGRAVRRKPIALPGGVLARSVEGAECLLRTPGARTLIDGYNVAKLGWPSLELEQQRQQCVAAAENLAKRWHIAMTVIFDGAEIRGAHASSRRRVRVAYSPAGVSADDVVRAEVDAADVAQPLVVVTNDRAILSDVRAAGANTVSSADFLALARR